MAAAIRTSVKTGQLEDAQSLDTAQFITDLNNLFDSLNSKRLFTSNPYNCGLSNKNSMTLTAMKRGKEIFENLIKFQNTELCRASNNNIRRPTKK